MPNSPARIAPQRAAPRSYWVQQIALPPEMPSLPLLVEMLAAADEEPGARESTISMSDDLAHELWYRVRSVRLWAEVYDDQSGDGLTESLRQPFYASDVPPTLAPAVDVLRSIAGRESAVPVRVAEACARIAEWAAEYPLPQTAIAFAEAAAAACPTSSRAMLLAARLNRICGQGARAEVFYERAIICSRRRRRWDLYVRANLGLGTLWADRGDVAAALSHFHAAARAAASESGERWLAAQTAHDLFVLLADVGQFEAAEAQAAKAITWYPKHHARFPLAVHDFAMILVRQGDHTSALALLEHVVRAKLPAVDEVIVWSTYARALGGIGACDEFSEAEAKLCRIIELFPHHGAAAFVNIAFGCYALGRLDCAERYVIEGIRRAKTSTSPEALVGQELLNQLNSGHPATASNDDGGVEQQGGSRVEVIAEALLKLKAWRGPTWRRKRQAGPGSVDF